MQTNSEKNVRISQLKDEITRVVSKIGELKHDKKTTVKGFNNAIKDKESELVIHLNELKELQNK